MATDSCILRNMATFQVLQQSPHPSSDHLFETSLDEVQQKSVLSQLRPSTSDPSTTHIQHDERIKGFTTVTVAGAFIASIQSQIMSTTLSVTPETKALLWINSLYLVGLVLDILSALLAFLAATWLERLTEPEKDLFEMAFSYHNPLYTDEEVRATPLIRPWKVGDREWFYYTWLGLSFSLPLPLLALGIMCMMVGLCTYSWTQQPVVVATLATLASVAPLPFILNIFIVGKNRDRRNKLIIRQCEMQRNW